MYSQRDEQKYILDYFGNIGIFLDIGAFHPEIFSNVRALYERGWKGICVEPSDACYPLIEKTYKGTVVETYHCAIANYTGKILMYDSNGDALSSTDPEHVRKWTENYGSKFTKITYPCYTIADLIKKSKYKAFNFVSIDVENDRLGIDILKQIDLYSVGMICLECDYKNRNEVKQHLKGWKEIYNNAENILMAR